MKSNIEWLWWGKNDPLYGVASWDGRQRGGSCQWTDEEFYALGDDWIDFKEHWQRYGLPRGTILELGCGAGRITNRLSTDFDQVIAVDVSDDMLAYAKKRIHNNNVEYVVYDGNKLPVDASSVDAVFSCHVFQHFPNNISQKEMFNEVYRILKPGGGMMVHIPLHQFSTVNRKLSHFFRASYSAYQKLANVKASVRRWQMKMWGRPYMHGVSYEISALLCDMAEMGFGRREVVYFQVRTNGSLHSCILAEK
jgi:SAM-dependent methyltransferase